MFRICAVNHVPFRMCVFSCIWSSLGALSLSLKYFMQVLRCSLSPSEVTAHLFDVVCYSPEIDINDFKCRKFLFHNFDSVFLGSSKVCK